MPALGSPDRLVMYLIRSAVRTFQYFRSSNWERTRALTWVVGGDYNISETFDRDWQNRNGRRFAIRSSGNAEMLERMRRLGFTECLRKYSNDEIVPTFIHSRGLLDHQIDHLFVSDALSLNLAHCGVGDPTIIFGRSFSDHLPIIAEFNA